MNTPELTQEQIEEVLADPGISNLIFDNEVNRDYFCKYIASKGYEYSQDTMNIRSGTETHPVWKITYWKAE